MMSRDRIESLLRKLRQQALNVGTDRLGSHQIDAHWSLAYACGQPAEPWEIYRVPALHLLPSTSFFTRHSVEIQEALQPYATWELLREHAVPKLALQAGMTEQECRDHGYPGRVQFIDYSTNSWTSVDVPAVRWFDGRQISQESLAQSADELQARVARHLQRLRDAARKDPTPRRLSELSAYERYVTERLPSRLQELDVEREKLRRWLAKIEVTPDLRKHLFTILRASENKVRAVYGLSAVGEAWVSETELLYRVQQILPGTEVIAHGQPRWLGRQHLDIWVPSLHLAIEYQGVQHFKAIDFFGGEEALRQTQERDRRKLTLCAQNGVRLIAIAYDQDLDDDTLRRLIRGSTPPT